LVTAHYERPGVSIETTMTRMPKTFRHRNLPHLFLSAREVLMLRFRPILNAAGLTEQQWRVLRTLHETAELDAATLAQRAQVLSPSLTRMLRVLEESGLIERHAAPDDLRRLVIRLSDKGNETVGRLGPEIEAVYHELERSIGPELLYSLYNNVDDMIHRVQNQAPSAPEPFSGAHGVDRELGRPKHR